MCHPGRPGPQGLGQAAVSGSESFFHPEGNLGEQVLQHSNRPVEIGLDAGPAGHRKADLAYAPQIYGWILRGKGSCGKEKKEADRNDDPHSHSKQGIAPIKSDLDGSEAPA